MSLTSSSNFTFNHDFLSNSNVQFESESIRNFTSDNNVTFTKVELGSSFGPNVKTQIHAVLDYDDDDNGDGYDNHSYPSAKHFIAPIQGPIYVRNDSVPIIPQFTQPILSNGTLLQIPIFWNTLAIALGYELHGNLIHGLPCIKRNHQLFCPTKNAEYPEKEIELFIDENKALMSRMYGDLNPYRGFKMKRSVPEKVTSICESEVSFETPFWAMNLNNKTRAVVNTEHFRQSIQFEKCKKNKKTRCPQDCRCHQKYSYHRLLAYDPQEKCRGIFMDWFLFPSCCVCSCSSS